VGKASRKKKDARTRADNGQRKDAQAIELLKELPGRWIIRKEGQPVGTLTGSRGIAALIFQSEYEARSSATLSNGEPELIGDIRRLLSDLAETGIPSLVEAGSGIELQTACRLDEVARTSPTYLVAGEPRRPKAAMTRTGRVMESVADLYLVPWRRFDLIDQAIARRIGPESSSPFPGIEGPFPIWALATPDAWPLFSEFPVIQPWPIHFGSFAFFTSESAATEFIESNLGGRIAFVHPGGKRSFQKPRPRQVDCILGYLKELLPAAGPTRFVINPFDARSISAIGSVDSPYIRTVAGVWELGDRNQVRFLQPWTTWTTLDTFHWAGGDGVRLEQRDRSFVPSPQLDDDLTDDERQHLIEVALAREPEPPSDPLDGFLLVLQHSTDSSRWTWHLFSDFSSCLGWAVRFEEQVDLPTRIAGIDPQVELGVPPGQLRAERKLSTAFGAAAQRLARRGTIEPYTPQGARDLAAMCNATLRTRRVHVTGYVRDLATQAKNDDWLNDLVSTLGPDGPRLVSWLDDNNELAVDPNATWKIQERIGEEPWRALDLRSRHFLGSAVTMLDQHRGRDDLDHSSVIVGACKVIEVELAELTATFRGSPEVNAEHDPTDWNDRKLRSFLDGTDKLTLGNFGKMLRPGTDTSALRAAFRAHVASLPGGEYLTHKDFAGSFLHKVGQRRNPASHDTPIDWPEAEAVIELVLGQDKQNRNALSEIVRWKTDPKLLSPSLTRSRFTPHDGHLVMEHFQFDTVDPGSPTEDDDLELLPLLEEDPFFAEVVLNVLPDEFREQTRDWIADSRRAHERPTNARLRKLPPLQRAIAELHESPFWDRNEAVGMIGSDEDEVVWRLQPGHLIGRANGGVVHFLMHHSGLDGDAFDTMFNIFDRSTMVSLSAFLGGTDASWIHRRGTFAIERLGLDPAPRLSMYSRRTRPPGGWIPSHLGSGAADLFSDIVKQLVDGKWGELIAPDADGGSTIHSRPDLFE